MVIKLAKRVLRTSFARYFIASVGALAVDMGSFAILLQTPLLPGLVAAISYTLGIIVHWILLSRSVFHAGTAARGQARTQQKAVFLLVTWVGLALTSGIVSVADMVGADIIISKGLAVIVSFILNYFIRKHFVFTAQAARRDSGEEGRSWLTI